MKTRIIILVGLVISCTMALHAEDLQLLPGTNEVSATAVPLIHQEAHRTNEVIRWTPTDRLLTDAGMANVLAQAAATNTSLLVPFTENEILYWMSDPETTNTTGRYGVGNKRKYQTIVIETVPSAPVGFTSKSRVGEYRFDTNHPQPTWYEWFNPRLFLVRWVDYWSNETNATPVVLVLVRF